MSSDIRTLSFFLVAFIIFRLVTGMLGFTCYYFDVFLPMIPFFALLNNNNLLLILFLIMGFLSSLIHYDEMFATMLGYGISLILLLSFSKKYSLINVFNYLLSVVVISLIVFVVQIFSYFAKDKIIVIQELYEFVLMNLIAGFLYYYAYRIAVFRRTPENVKR